MRQPWIPTRRRGAAILVVLLLITITLALSYSLMRWQGTSMQIRGNADLRSKARNAAYFGMRKAIERMQTRQWAGVREYAGDQESLFTGMLSTAERYEVTFSTGDPALAEGHPDYDEYAFRVTLVSTGYAADPSDSRREANYRIQAVVRLIPEKLSPQPANWSEMVGYTLCQRASGTFAMNVPFRIEGSVRAQQRIDLAKAGWWLPWYFWSNEVRTAYLLDLKGMGDKLLKVSLPNLGKGVTIKVLAWTAAEGAAVTVGDELLKVSAGPSIVPIRSPVSGVLTKQLVAVGQTVTKGQKLAEIMRNPYLPFTGRLYLPKSQQEEYGGRTLLEAMGIPVVDKTAATLASLAYPSALPTYQIYPGGKVYSAEALPSELRNQTDRYQPNPVSNPLGMFYRSGGLRLYDNVRIRGTVITRGYSQDDVTIYGRNVHLEPMDLPLREGSVDVSVQLPMALVGDEFVLSSDARASIAGLLVIGREFRVSEGPQGASESWTLSSADAAGSLIQMLQRRLPQLSASQAARLIRAGCVKIAGTTAQLDTTMAAGQTVVVYPYVLLSRVLTKDVYVGGRYEWFNWYDWWDRRYEWFQAQKTSSSGIAYFPAWLDATEGLVAEPERVLRPDPFAPRYHWWANWNTPIYDFKDDRLRWELVSWTENPR